MSRATIVALVAALLVVAAAAVVFVLTRRHAEVPPPPPPPPHFDTQVARGEWLFRTTGCPACHGEHARGGIANANYAADTVPELDLLADQLGLDGPEDAQAVIAIVEHGQDPGDYHGAPPFPGWDRFVAHWQDLVHVVQNGSVAGKKDPNGPAPPLQMPSWRATLAPDAIHAILAYLISLYDWNA